MMKSRKSDRLNDQR